MSSYIGHYAQLYNEIYSTKSYEKEVDFIAKQLRTRSRIFELASGTGHHAFLFEKKGFSITATDYSDSMLEVAKKTAKEIQSHVTFMKLDMRQIPAFKKKVDAMLCLFDSIGYVLTNEAVLRVLNGVKKNLKKDGFFVFEFWHASAMLRHFDPLRKRTFHLSNNHILRRISKTSIDYQSNIVSVAYILDEYDGKKRLYHIKETQQNRFFSIPEIELFLNKVGLKAVKFFSGYSEKEIISDRSFHILCFAQKQHI